MKQVDTTDLQIVKPAVRKEKNSASVNEKETNGGIDLDEPRTAA